MPFNENAVRINSEFFAMKYISANELVCMFAYNEKIANINKKNAGNKKLVGHMNEYSAYQSKIWIIKKTRTRVPRSGLATCTEQTMHELF